MSRTQLTAQTWARAMPPVPKTVWTLAFSRASSRVARPDTAPVRMAVR